MFSSSFSNGCANHGLVDCHDNRHHHALASATREHSFQSGISAVAPILKGDGSGSYTFSSCENEVMAWKDQVNQHVASGLIPYFLTLTFNPWGGGQDHRPDVISKKAFAYFKRSLIGKYLLNDTHWDRKDRATYAERQAVVPRIYGFLEKHGLCQIRGDSSTRFHVHAIVLANPCHTANLDVLVTSHTKEHFVQATESDILSHSASSNSVLHNTAVEAFPDMEAPMTDQLQNLDTPASLAVVSWRFDQRLRHDDIQSVDFRQCYCLEGLEGYVMKGYHKYRDHSFMIGPVDLPAKITDPTAPLVGLITPSKSVTPNQKRRHHRARHGHHGHRICGNHTGTPRQKVF